MILAAGLSPAWQQIMRFDSFQPGEVNRARDVHWCASGKVLNAGIATHHLGSPSKTLALVGGASGQAIQNEFAELGVTARWVNAKNATRVCTTILETSNRRTTELVENARPAEVEELEAYREAFRAEAGKADVVIATGSLPTGAPSDYYLQLIDSIAADIILDIRGPEMLQTLGTRPLLVKPNREELEKTAGKPLANEQDLIAAMRDLNAQGAQWVAISDGALAVYLTSAEECYRLQPPKVEVVNPIGCGDCMAAGIATAIHEGRPMADAVRFGIAAAGDNVRQLLPARLDRERVETLCDLVDVASL